MESIVVDPENPQYDSRDNCNAIIETSTNKLIVGSRNTIIPQSVTDYGQYGLVNCVNIKLPEGIEEIPNLYNCSNLESITIPNSIKKIYDLSFSGCSSLKSIIIEDGTEELLFEPTYTYNGYKPKWFTDCPLDSIYLGRIVRPKYSEYDYLPFRELSTLRTIVFGQNITDIPSSFFTGCINLCSVKLSENVKSIGNAAFANCVNLQSINFNSQLETIGQNAFGWSNLNKIVIPASVKTIGQNAFGCSHLSYLIFEDGDDDVLLDGREKMFWGDTIDSLYWGRNGPKINFKKVKHISLADVKIKTFGGITCDSVYVLDIKAGKDTLSISPFGKELIIDSIYCDRVLDVNASGNHPLYLVSSMFKLELGNTLTEIGDNMFYSCKIPSLFIPNNIKRISPTAFNDCYTLSTVTIEDSTEPLDFGEGNNFYGCQLREVYLGRNMQYLTNSPFNKNKEGIINITLGENVTEIPANAFLGLKNINALVLPHKLKKINEMAFYGCEGLTSLTIPSSVVEIGMQAFDLCRGLKTLTFEDGSETLAFTATENNLNNAFQNSPLEEIYLGRNISFTNSSPLCIIESLKTLTIGSEVTHLADRAFIGCPNLNNVTSYANVVPTTGENVFTPSYLPNDTLHVAYELYNQYKVAPTWKDFGTIMNFEGLYNLTYIVDGEVYKDSVIEQNSPIVPEAEPTKEGYTFSGWSEIPETMPAKDVTVTGTFTINKYKITYMIDNEVYKVVEYEYGATITPEPQPEGDYSSFEWIGLPETMPAKDIVVQASYEVSGIIELMVSQGKARIFSPSGKAIGKLQKGLNIVVLSDGTIKKVMMK